MSTITLINDVHPVVVDIDTENDTVQVLLERELGSGVQVLPDGTILVNGEEVLLVSDGTSSQAIGDFRPQGGETVIVNTKHDNG
jgi:hypothetical protein